MVLAFSLLSLPITALGKKGEKNFTNEQAIATRKELLESKASVVNELDVLAENFENSGRNVRLVKVLPCYHIFKDLVSYYAVQQLAEFILTEKVASLQQLQQSLPVKPVLQEWVNVGGQLIPQPELDKLLKHIQSGKIKSWAEVHDFYKQQGNLYPRQKLHHAIAALKLIHGIDLKKISSSIFSNLLQKNIQVREWMVNQIHETRAKDYQNPFRRMIYDNEQEMDKILGSIKDNSFINQETAALQSYKKTITSIIQKFSLEKSVAAVSSRKVSVSTVT